MGYITINNKINKRVEEEKDIRFFFRRLAKYCELLNRRKKFYDEMTAKYKEISFLPRGHLLSPFISFSFPFVI